MNWQDKLYENLTETRASKKTKKAAEGKHKDPKKTGVATPTPGLSDKRKLAKKSVTQVWDDDPMDPKYDQYHNAGRSGGVPGEHGGPRPKGRGN